MVFEGEASALVRLAGRAGDGLMTLPSNTDLSHVSDEELWRLIGKQPANVEGKKTKRAN